MDLKVLDAIAKLHGGRCPELKKVGSPRDMLDKLSRVHALVAMRLHAGIFAAVSGIPPLMVAYDPKVAAFSQMIGMPSVAMEGLTADRLWDNFRRYEEGIEDSRQRLAPVRDEMASASKKNITLLLELLG